MQLKINVRHQKLLLGRCEKIVAESRNYLYCVFIFDVAWDTITNRVAQFTSVNGKQYDVPIINGTCLVPWEVIQTPQFTVGVYGGDYLPTSSIAVQVHPCEVGEGGVPGAEPTPLLYDQLMTEIRADTAAAAQSATTATAGAQTATAEAANAVKGAQDAGVFAANAKSSETASDVSEAKALDSATKSQKAMTDLLAMIGTDVATLVGGKIPMGQIPATATQEIYTVAGESELVSLTAQRGDLAELIETVGGVRTITKTWQLLGTSAVRSDWVVWGTAYAVSAGNATSATNATNAGMINNHRMVEMVQADFDVAVKDPTTYYLVH